MDEGETRGREKERRAARRYKARHVARIQFVTPLADLREVDGTGLWPTLICQTLDVSERGLTLLVPTLREDDENFFGVKGPVLVTLALPAGTVSVKATAVRYERAGEGCPRAGCVLRESSPTSTTIRAAAYPSTTNNQIDNDQFFARRHYLDFLNREPDASGLQFWTKEMTGCGADAQCREVKRINVSATFFLSIEFQQTGYLAYRAHKAAYGNIPGKPVPITREEILSDMSQVGDGVIVGQDDWEQRLEFNKRAYFDALVSTDRFTTLYPHSLSPEQYVDALNSNAGGVLSQPERDLLVVELKSEAKGRAQALRAVAEDADLTKAEFNKAFVLMQFFDYLRRDPDSAPDTNFSGYNFWLGKLNEFNGNFIQAEMVKAFLNSIEYRQRFGQ